MRTRESRRWARSLLWGGLVGLAMGVAGCYQSAQDEVRQLATADLNCPENAISVTYIGTSAIDGLVYQAAGCKRSATYLCRADKQAFDTEYFCCNAARCRAP
ncbi:MAG: hypothetical protein U0165_02835 [Polyangiaceae bacterium]